MNTLAAAPLAKSKLQISMKGILLCYIFLALPLFDMLNGFLIGQGYLATGAIASPSQIGRFMGLILLLAGTIRHKYSPYIVLMLFGLCLLETIFFFRHNNITGTIIGFIYISRFLYMYLVFVFFLHFFSDDITPIMRFLKYNIIFICCAVILASFTGLANSTYGWGSGTKGFFASGNGLGIYIGVSALLLASLKQYRVYTNVHVAVFAVSAYTLVLLGTKTSFIMFLLVIIAGFWSSRFRILVIPAIIFGTIQFITQISDRLMSRYDIILLRYENSRSLGDYILSNRDVYAEAAWAEFLSQDPELLRWVFGGGAFLSFQNPLWVRTFDTLETDFFDVFFIYGLVGLTGYALFLFLSVKPFLRAPFMLVPTVLLWGHSAFAGHVLFNGLGATLVVLVFVIGIWFKDKKDVSSLVKASRSGSRNGYRR